MTKFLKNKFSLGRLLFLVAFTFFILGSSQDGRACICQPPGTVTANAATSVTAASFQANWSVPSQPCGAITNYSIDVSTSSTFTSSLAGYPTTTGSTGTSTILSGLTCGATYYYRIKGVTCGGSSAAWSNTVTVTLPACSCTDGIQNQGETGVDCGGPCAACLGNCTNGIMDGDETGVDCGGLYCAACPTCFDGIQNGTETGIDCGGTCAITCGTNTATVNSTCGACPSGISATIYSTNCSQVGTSAFNTNSPNADFAGCASFTAPTPSPTCATVGSYGTWMHFDLAAGVTQVQMAFSSGAAASGSANWYAAAYQGASCAALTAVPGGCQLSAAFSSSQYYAYNVILTNLNPSQDLWIFMFSDANKDFDLHYDMVGMGSSPSNTTCATANAAAGTGCNLGAPGASWTPPNVASPSVACTGGAWSSNDNTTYYTFTPTASTATLTINSIACNDGASGSAQFAVWTSCAAIGTYTNSSTYLGCSVGGTNTSLSLTGLTSGQTYYIAVDGSGGDDCIFTFTGTNINLPVELLSFKARFEGSQVNINWTTLSERNCAYFEVQKSNDGELFETVSVIKGSNTVNTRMNYGVIDRYPTPGITYYRLKQVDVNGQFKYSAIDIVNLDKNGSPFSVLPNPTRNNAYVNYSCGDGETCVLTLYNTNGVPVLSKTMNCQKGLNTELIDLSEQMRGIYLVVLTTDTKTYKAKLVKE